ncbi:MAG: SLC26A/SulP transporter family protein [Gammaproteobacteria bacterium]|nr:SLC26A/SulP transporter family protein [Gammaproteobacteria bacterium]
MINRSLIADFWAATVAALTTLPQTIAYGLIALSPLGPDWALFGIIASLGSTLVFGLITGATSSNPFLLSGPRAVTALVVASAIETGVSRGLAPELAVALAFLGVAAAGLLQFSAGVLRLGGMTAYLPVPVLAGFVSASALIVFFNSLPAMLDVPQLGLVELFRLDLNAAHLWALTVGLTALLLTLVLNPFARIVPAAIWGLIGASLLYALGIEFLGLGLAPNIGLIELSALIRPPIAVEMQLTWALLQPHWDIPLLSGLSIALLASFDTVLTSSSLKGCSREQQEYNRDLRIHGLSNGLMGLFGFLPGSGTLSRSTALIASGAQTRAANTGTVLVFLLMISALSGLVQAIPLWATSGMLAATALLAVDRATLEKIGRLLQGRLAYKRVLIGDILITLLVAVIAVAFNLIAAVGAGMALAAMLFVLGMARDPVRRVYFGHRVHSKTQRPQWQLEHLERSGRSIAVIELHGALFFGACARLQSLASQLLAEGVRQLIIDFRYLNSIDSSGTASLKQIQAECQELGGQLMISCIERERRHPQQTAGAANSRDRRKAQPHLRLVWLHLLSAGLIAKLGEGAIFDSTDKALAHSEELLLAGLTSAEQQDLRQIIGQSPLFQGLSPRQIASLGAAAKRSRFKAGELIFAQGEPGDRAYFLLSGRVEAQIQIPGSSRNRSLASFVPGTLFGEMAMLDGSPRSASVLAIEESQCLWIDAQGFRQFEQDEAQGAQILLRNIACQFAERLRLANNTISELER